jgi:hypothetical protein
LPTRALHRKRALALPEAAHLAHAAPDVDREDLRVLVEAGRPGAAPAALGKPAARLRHSTGTTRRSESCRIRSSIKEGM